MDVSWSGPAAPRPLRATLESAGLRVRAAARAPGAPLVVCTRTARVPATPLNPRWIWACLVTVPERSRIEAVLRGAYDVVSLPAPDAAPALAARLQELLTPDPPVPPLDTLVTTGEASKRVVAQAARVAETSMPVLLTGETGTGKEVLARVIHAWSPRRTKRFVPINCAAIPNELMEAELFGYARGAFSGAVQRYDGQLMAAAGGSVFLDEIDDTPLETQVKLLRVLEDRVVSRLGENEWHEVDFRILAATNRDLKALVEEGAFGMDLYERLAIVTIQLPPLRERIEDLEALAGFFVARFAREHARPVVAGLRADALRALRAYPWPGNIRELRNVLYETLVYKRAGAQIILSDLPRRILHQHATLRSPAAVDRTAIATKVAAGTMSLRAEIAALEQTALDEALRRSGGNASEAARLLGTVGRGRSRDPGATVRAMMKRLGRK